MLLYTPLHYLLFGDSLDASPTFPALVMTSGNLSEEPIVTNNIDEILTLRTMTLTDEEKREARGTDERAAAIIDRSDTMPPEILSRLHGTMRSLRQATEKTEEKTEKVPWWDPGADASVSPDTDRVEINGASVGKGSRVRLRPERRADAQDMFLTGRTATVEAVVFDVEDRSYLAVTLADDPAAREGHVSAEESDYAKIRCVEQ